MAEERIGRYRILEEIASGTQGTVYRGFDAETGRLVAVKILHASLTGDATYLERFHREATLAASIDHQNVVRIYEVGEDAGRHFMALEFLPENLARLIQSGGLPPERAASLTAEIADGLAAAHACGIVHRDVKPQNILVTPEGTPKVTDFGIARGESLSTMTSTGMMMGTPYYMSPEQALGERADARSDVYSLGCVLYQMLTGEVPFQASTPLAVLRQHTDVQPRPVRQLRSDVPRGLADIVQRSMEKAPARRYANAGEMASALRSAMPGLAPAAATPAASRVPRGMAPPPPPPWEPAEFAAPPPARPRRGGGRRFAYVFGGLCLIGAIAAAAVLVVGSISTQVPAPLPRPTPMPVPVARELTATPAPRLLETPVPRPLVVSSPSVYFEDTFDGGVLKPEWRLGLIPGAAPGDGWQLEWDEDAYQLVGRGNAFAAIGDHAWIDFKLETRIRLDRGSGHVNLMADDRGYSVRLPELDLMMAELGPGIDPSAYEVLAKSDGPYLQYGRWYDLTVVVIANRLEVYVDGEPAFAYAGPQPMPKTRIDFESHLDSVLRVRSAMILGVQDHLPAPAPAGEAPRPLLFRDTFDGGVLQPGWQIQPAPGAVPWARWDLTWDEGAYQLVGEEHAHALIGGDSWTDYRVEAQVRLDRGSGRLNFRLGQQGRYNVTLPEVVLGVDRPAPDGNDWGYRRLAESARPRMEYGRWYEIWVVASGNRIEVYVDGEMAIGYADPDPLWAGAVEFESFADSVLRVQWVTVLGGTDLFPAPGPTREAPSGVLFEDTFDGGVLQPAWRLQPADDAAPGDRWEMVWEEGEPQLIGRGHALAAIGDETWTDYRIDARVRLDEGNGHLNFRTGKDRRYTVRLPEVSLYADKYASERNTHWTGQLAANIGPAMEHGRWADLSVTVSGNRIEVYVDGGLAVSYVDPDPIPSGGVDFESLSRSTLRVAEVQVVTDDGFGAPPSSDAEPGVALRDDFEGGAGHVWSDGRVSHSGPFTQFLGRFGNDTVSVKLTDLPAHNLVRLMFDLYVIDSWDGNDPGGDPDYFQVGFGSSTDNLLSETFTRFCPNPDQMSYAATQPEVCGTDLGFDPASQDVIYRNLNNGFTFEHSGGELVLNFTGRNLEGIDNESWGIDNVRVFVGARVHEPRTFVDEPGAFVVAGSDLGPFTIVRFESRPDGTPLHDREQLDGSEFAERGVWFEAPEFPAYGLQICGPAAWQESNSLSPGRCPQDAGEDDDDGLIVRFDPPVVAAQLRLIDNDDGGQGESVAFLDTSGAVIGWIGHLPGSWAGMVSPGTPIAEIRIVESQEGDDVTYDDVLFVQAAAGNVSPSAGAEGRFTPNGHYYKVVRVEEGIRWGQAMERARNMSLESVQGYLATITSPEENEWVRRLVSDAGVGNTWLGGVQAVPNAGPASDWHWITGERWEYTNWAGGEPNDSGQDEIYLVFAEADAWNDAAPGSSPAFVVEFPLEPVTETAPAYDLHANVVASYDGPASMPPHERNLSRGFFLQGTGPRMPDSVQVTFPDGAGLTLPAYTDVFSPGTDWVSQFRFGETEPDLPPPGLYVFSGFDAANNPIPGIDTAVFRVGTEPPDPPVGLSARTGRDGLTVTWQPVARLPGTFEPDNNVGFYHLTVQRPGWPAQAYGAGSIREPYHLVPLTRSGFGSNSHGSPISEWADGTYRLAVAAYAFDSNGQQTSLVSSQDTAETLLLRVEGGFVVNVAYPVSTSSAPTRIAIFHDDFEGGARDGWSTGITDASRPGNFTEFLGRFGNETVSLELTDLPPHALVELHFDLFIIDSWDGSNPETGPDYFRVGFGGSIDNLLAETFGMGCMYGGMSYAGTPPEICGYDLGFNPEFVDAIYRDLDNGRTFEHTDGTLTINFSGSGLQDLDDESWGIDNVSFSGSGLQDLDDESWGIDNVSVTLIAGPAP